MFDTVRHRPSERSVGRSAKLVLTAAAVFTLLAGGTALATTSTASGNDTRQGPAAQSLLHAGDSGITEAETETADTDAADGAAEAAADAAEAAKEAADGAQGVHGACVSKVAQDTTTVGRAHGLAVSKAAHECPKGSDTAAGAAKGAEKSSAAQAKRAAKSAARTARGKS
jgi:colicin import membrane protein